MLKTCKEGDCSQRYGLLISRPIFKRDLFSGKPGQGGRGLCVFSLKKGNLSYWATFWVSSFVCQSGNTH